VSAVWDRVAFTLNGEQVDVPAARDESLLSVLRERLRVVSAKDGCAPQGQCGCCTVLVDGEPRVACVTPAQRVAGRAVTTLEGLDPALRDDLVESFVDAGGSQCGFCTPGIVVRASALRVKERSARRNVDRALGAHLCRCTGWQTVYEAIDRVGAAPRRRDLTAASRRAALEGGTMQQVGAAVPLGTGGFADDEAPRDALVAVPLPPGSEAPSIVAAGACWVLGDTLHDARAEAAKVQGRRTTAELTWPLTPPPRPVGGVRLATTWVEPAYLEPDASWCEPGGEPASPLANGGAFGGKESSIVGRAARELADATGRVVRVVFAREDVVRLGPKRPPIAATARLEGATVELEGQVAGTSRPFTEPIAWPYVIDERGSWRERHVAGPPTAAHLRAVGFAERVVLVEGALTEAGVDRREVARDARVQHTLLDSCAQSSSGALAGARVELDEAGNLLRVTARVAAGDPLDEVVLRSYAIGAVHMALGWVLTEGIAVDLDTGDVHDLTIRSFGIIRAKDTPPIDIEIVDDEGPPLSRASDAVFAAVAAAAWNALTVSNGVRPERFPARDAPAARRLRR
jgi:xanthine dehydrogenase small subunit